MSTDTAVQFQERNTVLFTERLRVQQELSCCAGEGAMSPLDDPAVRRVRARLQRALDAVTAEIVELNRGLVRNYVRRFTSNTSAFDSEDFEGAGLVGLMRAIDTYDPSRGKFGSWAFKPIRYEVLRAVRDSDHQSISTGDFERRPDILRAFGELRGVDEEYFPSAEEVASRAGCTVEQARRVLNPARLDSLSTPVSFDGATIGDLIEDRARPLDEMVLEQMDFAALSAFGLSCLDHRELYVLSRRFGLDCEPKQRLSAIGETLHLSREAVRQVESKALSKLKHPVTLRRILSQAA